HAKRAQIPARRGDQGAAREHARLAISFGEPTGYVESLIEWLIASAEVELGGGNHGEAKRASLQARDIARWSKMVHFELRAARPAPRGPARARWRSCERWCVARTSAGSVRSPRAART